MRLIGITQRMAVADTGEKRDCLAQDWYLFSRALGLCWVALPNDRESALFLAETLDLGGLILSGGEDIGVYPERDACELELTRWALREKRPILGICRGFQLLHCFWGGSLGPVAPELHRGCRHAVTFSDGTARTVNSYHTKAPLKTPAPGFPLRPLAVCSGDGSLEAAYGQGILGVMWHPEREPVPAEYDLHLVKTLFQDCL